MHYYVIKTSETSDDSSCSDDENESLKPCTPTLPVNGKVKRKQSNDSDSASSIIPPKKKKISTVKSLIQEKKVLIPECKPSISIFVTYTYLKIAYSCYLISCHYHNIIFTVDYCLFFN